MVLRHFANRVTRQPLTMNFEESLSEFKFISDLYQRDAADAVFLADQPSTKNDAVKFKNIHKYILHEPIPVPEKPLLSLYPLHFICGWGNRIGISSDFVLSEILMNHWATLLGDESFHKVLEFDEKKNYITLFPIESLPPEKQVIHPDIYYHLHSKEVISEIDCGQAKAVAETDYPFILKLSHSYAGIGNFYIRNEAEFEDTVNYIESNWPNSKYIINEMISDIVNDYHAQFYLDRAGAVTWIGCIRPQFDSDKHWTGGLFSYDEQQMLYEMAREIVHPVANFLHKKGYFGIVGIDVLQDSNKNQYLVDLNPRLNSSTPTLIASRQFLKKNFSAAIYKSRIELKGSLAEIVSKSTSSVDGIILIQAAVENPNRGITNCELSIHGKTHEVCKKILNDLLAG